MKKGKKYFKSPYIKGDESYLHNEFSEKLPLDHFITDQQENDHTTSRRDFLKFLGFSTAAAVLSSYETPVRKSIPYLNKPEEIIPGVANYYSSTYFQENVFANILVKTREGRPISVSANKEFEKNIECGGGLNSRGYASVLSLYDSNRLKFPLKNKEEISWKNLDSEIMTALKEVEKTNKKITFLTSTIISPTFKNIISKFSEKYKNFQVVYFDPISKSGILEANNACFGEAFIPTYSFDKAKVIVSFESDFLGEWLDSGHAKQYSKGREPGKNMSKHYQFESLLSLTGSNADKRIPLNPDQQLLYLTYIYDYLTLHEGSSLAPVSAYALINHKPILNQICEELKANKGSSLIVSGSNNVKHQLVVNAINYVLDNYSKTIDWNRKSNLYSSINSDFQEFVQDVQSNKIGALIINDVNIAYNYPSLKDELEKINLKVSFSESLDETASLMNFVCAKSHYLESWGDANPYTGVYTLQQPAINPIFNTRESEVNFLSWMGMNQNFYNYLKSNYKNQNLNKSWNQTLHDGFSEKSYLKQDYIFSSQIATDITQELNELGPEIFRYSNGETGGSSAWDPVFLMLYSKTSMGEGKQSNNPWLQELPDPISKVTWDNYLTVSPAYAKRLGLKNWHVANGGLNGDIVILKREDKTLRVPIYIQPGQQEHTLGLAFGYGRYSGGKVANGVGVNAFEFFEDLQFAQKNGFSLEKIKRAEHEFACTQNSHTMMGRSIVKETTLKEYLINPKAGNKDFKLESYKGKVSPSELNLYEEHEPAVHFWNMSIDLNKCNGCGACVIACHAENNVPVVGKEEVRKNRDMHWLRIDRYYSSDMTKQKAKEEGIGAIEMYKKMEEPASAENLEVVFQPVMCQHCNHAPCETVCPVAATTHSREGLNHMTYNRCIGTRYCMNNCPYKVRRFNWFNYSENNQFDYNMNDDLGKMVLNPDVTVRSRGVMEKCTMCIQNIQKTKLDAKKERRKIKDGEIKCACEKACDTGAITFGDIMDPNSRVSAEKKNPRSYYLIEELNTQPSVFYKTKVRNKKV